MKKISILLFICFITMLFSPLKTTNADSKIIYKPDFESLQSGEKLKDELGSEGAGFVGDGKGGLITTTDNEYNAVYFGKSARQFHFHAEMESIKPNTPIIGGLSFKTNTEENGKRLDLAVTTGGIDKSVLIYANGILLADNRSENHNGLGGMEAFNEKSKVTIDLYGDRNYYAVFINNTLVIEAVLPIEGSGIFGLRAQRSLIRYSNVYIEELGDTLLDGRERFYPETFETISMKVDKEKIGLNEIANFEAVLEPTGKAYEDVTWYVDGEILLNVTDLKIPLSFSVAGKHEVICIVDRQRVIYEVNVSPTTSIVEDKEEKGCSGSIYGTLTAITVLTTGLFIARKKKKD